MTNNLISPNPTPSAIAQRRRISPIWLLPVVAFVASSWLIYKSFMEKGPEITITFASAEGLEVGKTKIKYRNVDIGKVTAIEISNDLDSVEINAELEPYTAEYLNEGTRFRVVKPQIGINGVSGLGTLLSGPYIEVDPGDGPRHKHFAGLPAPPVPVAGKQGRHYMLETDNLDGINPGTPIHFHGVAVGEVLSHRFSADGANIRLPIFIKAPYHRFINQHTRFWKQSGIDFSASADGFQLKTGPLVSMLSGAIAFYTPAQSSTDDRSFEDTQFALYDSYDQTSEIIYRNTLRYILYFQNDVRGLSEGAPVLLLGIPVGKVINVNLEIDAKSLDVRIPVVIEIEPDRVQQVNGASNLNDQQIVDLLVDKGLRAQLQTGSLLTGQLLIELGFHPQSPVRLTGAVAEYRELPTVPGSLDEFTDSARTIMNKVAKLPLDRFIGKIDHTLQSLQTALDSATTTMVSGQQAFDTLAPGSTARYEFEQMLREMTVAAKSVRTFANYLEQNPNALIHGK